MPMNFELIGSRSSTISSRRALSDGGSLKQPTGSYGISHTSAVKNTLYNDYINISLEDTIDRPGEKQNGGQKTLSVWYG